jgi:DNA-binding NarL/FixJ family response regulator
MDGFELARKVHEKHQIGVVVVSGRISPDVGKLPPGVHFVAKPVHKATLIHLVRDVARSEPELRSVWVDAAPKPMADWTLTPRQQEALKLLVQGKSNREIAKGLGLSENTVKVHSAAVYRALGVSSRTEALLKRMSGMPVN